MTVINWFSVLVSIYTLAFTLTYHQDDECDEREKLLYGKSHKTVVIFVDKSISVGTSDFAAKKYKKTLSKVLTAERFNAEDRLIAYELHHNTLSGKFVEKTCSKNEINKDKLCALANKTFDGYVMDQRSLIANDVGSFKSKLYKRLTSKTNPGVDKQTDIWGALQVLKEEKLQGAVEVFFLSDMVESMSGAQRRDMHTAPPQSMAQAREFATNDLPRLRKNCNVGKGDFKNVSVSIIFPHPPDAPKTIANPYVKVYWETLLNKLGITYVNFVLGLQR